MPVFHFRQATLAIELSLQIYAVQKLKMDFRSNVLIGYNGT
jgi:hypothetical protein